MKNIAILIAFLFMAQTASALQVLDGFYDVDQEKIVLKLQYSGGCGPHKFNLDFSKVCGKSYPSQSSATLTHETEDKCKMMVERHVQFSADKFLCGEGYLKIKNGQRVVGEVFIRANSLLK